MHITQTYLGSYGASDLYVYYLFEDYNFDQKSLTKKVQDALDDVGADYMKEIDIFRPNERFSGNISQEVRQIQPIWQYCHDKIPGFLITHRPLVEVDPKNATVEFFSIRGRSENEALEVVAKIREIAKSNIKRPDDNAEIVERGRGFIARLSEALEIKPGLFGVSLDLKILLRL